jgi:hypothetical protein
MNRHQRRAGAAKQRKFKEGTVIYTKTVPSWSRAASVSSDGSRNPTAFRLRAASGCSPRYAEIASDPGIELFGPFKTDAEVHESQRLTLLGPQCEVAEGGMWDPAWDKLQ